MRRTGRHAAARDENERPIIDALKAAGASVQQLDVPCDLLVGYRGTTHLVEVKNPAVAGAAPTPGQLDFERSWRGSDIHTVTTPTEALAVIGRTALELAP